ncbi:hypothetical protein M0804_010672 [Polistes exclamans]|nr:hypothetical protein M0804_010672 [Polistes exclamans]
MCSESLALQGRLWSFQYSSTNRPRRDGMPMHITVPYKQAMASCSPRCNRDYRFTDFSLWIPSYILFAFAIPILRRPLPILAFV